MRTTTINIDTYKDTGLMEAVYDLFGKPEMTDEEHDALNEKSSKIFEYGEYLNAEIIVDENLNIVGGKIIPFKNE